MSLNIKNERVHAMARQAAEATGLTMTGAIERALEEMLRGLGSDPGRARVSARVDAVNRIVADYAADDDDPEREIRTTADLYDEAGLPK